MPKGQASLARLARKEFPAAIADRWIGLLRPSYLLREAGDDEPIVGQLGGVPALPESLAWPRSDRYGPLSFVAEIDCGQLPSDTLSLPRTGTLSFFVHDDVPAARAAPENSAVARVLYVARETPVTRRDPPTGADSYDLVELTGELNATGPAWDSPVFRDAIADLADHNAFMNNWSNGDAFRQALRELSPRPPDHRLGGHAHPIQDAVEQDVAHAELGGDVSYADPALHQEALRWNLPAQFDSDQSARMMWGDSGTLYWLMRPADLAARRFEEASFTWQCT